MSEEILAFTPKQFFLKVCAIIRAHHNELKSNFNRAQNDAKFWIHFMDCQYVNGDKIQG